MKLDEPWDIYALRDPATEEIRYVGKSKNPKRRFYVHLSDARSGVPHATACWIRGVLVCGEKPLLDILESGTGDGYREAERHWIAKLRGAGAVLTNETDGGEGGGCPVGTRQSSAMVKRRVAPRLGVPLTPEHRKKIGDAQRGVPKPPEQVAKTAASKRGKPRSSEAIEKHRAKMIGHAVSDDTREKIGATKRGIPRKPETKARISASLTGKSLSAKTRAKLSVSQKTRRAREAAERPPAPPQPPPAAHGSLPPCHRSSRRGKRPMSDQGRANQITAQRVRRDREAVERGVGVTKTFGPGGGDPES